jgi:hypothetical protein
MERVKLIRKPRLNNAGTRVKAGVVRGSYETHTAEEKLAARSKRLIRSALYVQRAKDIKVGRPSMYMPEWHDDLVFDLRLTGCSIAQICAALNINATTFEEWKQKHPGFMAAWSAGGEEADAAVARSVFERATGYDFVEEKLFFHAREGEVVRATVVNHTPPDMTAAQYWLNNRRPAHWKNKSSSEITGPDGQALAVPQFIINPVRPAGSTDD